MRKLPFVLIMSDLPPELQRLAAFLDAQPGPVQVAFQYTMALLMVEAGKMRLVQTILSMVNQNSSKLAI